MLLVTSLTPFLTLPPCLATLIAYVYVPTKLALGQALGINVPCTAAAIEKAAGAEGIIKEVVSKISGKEVPSEKKAAEPKAEKKAPEKKQKEEAEKKE